MTLLVFIYIISRECRRPKCRNDRDCSLDQYCDQTHTHDCVEKCYSDRRCKKNEVCRAGRCYVRQCNHDGSVCSNGKGCKDIKCHCQSGTCVSKEKCYKKEHSCANGTYCAIDGKCMAETICNIKNNDCPRDEECNLGMGICVPPRRPRPCKPGRDNECRSDQRCDKIKFECHPINPIRCKRYDDCPGDDECDEEGICLPPRRPRYCKYHEDCSDGRLCDKELRKCILPRTCKRHRDCKHKRHYCDENNRCRPFCDQKSDCRLNEECSKDHECTIRQYCDIGIKPRKLPTHLIEHKPICKKGKECMNGICDIPECRENNDCRRSGDFCKRDYTCGSFCHKSKECQIGQKCRNGVCRVPCSKPNDCQHDEICDVHNEGGICLPSQRCNFQSECKRDSSICRYIFKSNPRELYCQTPKPCKSSHDCWEYETCKRYACIPTESCEKDRDCTSRRCLLSYHLCQRVVECFKTEDCKEDEFCNDRNICIKGRCLKDSDCAIESCRDGRCVLPSKCATDRGAL